jgi:PAS domain S-box-containing protein
MTQPDRPDPPRVAPSTWRLATRVSLGYAGFAAIWILASDRVLGLFVSDVALLSRLQTWKGWFFVALTATLLHLFIGRRDEASSVAQVELPDDRRLKWTITAAALVVMAAIMLNLAYSLWEDRSDRIREAEQTTQNLVQVIEEQTAGQINMLDLKLTSVAGVLRLLPKGTPQRDEKIQEILREDLHTMPFVRAVYVTDAGGRMIHDTDSFPAARFNFSDREYFMVHRDDPARGLYIGAPILSRTRGVWFISVSRRLSSADGSFAGVVVAAVEPGYLQRFFESIKVGSAGSVSMFRRDGTLLVRAPQVDGMLGRNFSGGSMITEQLPRSEIGTYFSTSSVDGVPRIFSYRTVPGRPLVVAVGVSRDEVLATWRLRAWTYGLVSLAFTAFIAWLGGLVVRELRRRAALNAALQSSEARFSKAFHASPAAESMADIDSGEYIDVNERYAELLGYTRGDLIGRTAFDMGVWSDPSRRGVLVEQLMRDGMVRDFHARFRRRDGDEREMQMSAVITQLGNRQQKVMISIFNDITDRLRSEREMAENERRYRMLFDANPHSMWVYDHETLAILAVNEAAVAHYGYAREEFLRLRISDLWPPEDVARLLDRNQGLDPAMRRSLVWRHRRKNGELIDVQIDSESLEFAGRPARLALATDVTEKLRAERALIESARLNSTVLNALQDVILVRDRDSVIQVANPIAAKLFGIPVDAMIGRFDLGTSVQYFREDGTPQTREMSIHFFALRDGQARHGLVLRIVRPDGGESWVESSAIPLYRDGEDSPYAVVSKFTDITERKKAGEEIKRLNSDLERRVTERTAELEAANQELESFGYSVSHDLRAPLRHMDGFARMAAERLQGADDTTRRYLETITRSAEKMGLLIDGLLALSRAGRAELRARPISLASLVREAQDECMRDAAGRSIAWAIGDLPVVFGDAALLRQVFINLLENAVKFTRHRSEARIEIEAVPAGAGEVCVTVRDNGAGFDMRYVDKLFGVFQRLHREDEFSGTGIGLATVKRIVERHGGRVRVESQLEHGTVFYVTLPIGPGGVGAPGGAGGGE